MTDTVKNPPTARELVAAKKSRQADTLPANAQTSTPAVPAADTREYRDRYLDEICPNDIVGRLVKFSKDGEFETTDDSKVIPAKAEFVALTDQVAIGWIRFHADESPPDKEMGLLYAGYVLPPRQTLGDLDASKWPLGLDNTPQDPWQHFIYLPLQNTATQEMFTFSTSSKTGRRAVGTLLRHYDRMRKAHPNDLPRVRLSSGGFNHKDSRIGWVHTPVFVVVGRAPRDEVPSPEPTPTAAYLNDELPI
jgi:hypothetical protein